MASLSDADIGLSDADIGLGGGNDQPTAQKASGLSDADIGLSDADIGLDQPQGEGALGTTARAAAHGVIPTVTGLLGMGAGEALGGPIGAIGGMAAGSYLGEKLQHGLQDLTGTNDDAQMQADIAEHPRLAQIGGAIPAVATLGVGPASAGVRAASAGIMGAFQGVQDLYNTGHLDPAAEAVAAGVGAVAPGNNRVGEAISGVGKRFVPGRPGRVANPESDITHTAVDDTSTPVDANETALGEEPPNRAEAQTVAIGNPQSRPTNSQGTEAIGKSDGSYAKAGLPSDNSQVTTGDMDPATSAALQAAAPPAAVTATVSEKTPVAPPQAVAPGQPAPKPAITSPDHPIQQAVAPVKDPINNAQGTPGPEQQQQAPRVLTDADIGLPVHAGFPKPGEPLAVGENEATALPKNQDRDFVPTNDKQLANSKSAGTGETGETPPPIKGTPAAPTPDQAAAGNYFKGRSMDFGKPQAIENLKGSERSSHPDAPVQWKSTLPADYGYFNKTKGADGDHIDFYRAEPGSPEFGQKHFIIDQKNADTGRFDEHKVMTYFKDQPAAVDTYMKAFSDNRGGDRLHDVTEVERPELTAWLAKHTTRPANKPYGEPLVEPKIPAVAQVAADKLRSQGRIDEANALLSAPPEKLAAATAGQRTRKYGVPTGNSAGYPIEGLVGEDGRPITANSKASAAQKATQHKAVEDWFDKSSLPSQLKPEDEANGELLNRIKAVPPKGWSPGHKPASWLLAREARSTLAKPTPANVAKFREAEASLRGSKEDVDNWRSTNRTAADIALSRRSGDAAIGRAEAGAAVNNPHGEEDAMIAKLDEKRGFEVPHEESESIVEPTPVKTAADLKPLPEKTVDVNDTKLASIDTNKISADVARRREEAKMLAGRKSEERNRPAEELKAETKKPSIDINDPKVAMDYVKRLNEAQRKRPTSEGEINQMGRSMGLAHEMARAFIHDDTAALNLSKLKQDFDRLLKGAAKFDPTRYIDRMKKTQHDSYLSQGAGGPRGQYVRSLDERLHTEGDNEDVNQTNRILNDAHKNWGDIDATMAKQIFRARDADSAGVVLPNKIAGKTNVESLPKNVLDLYNQHLKPVFDNNDRYFKAGRALAPDKYGDEVQHHIEHIMDGDTAKYNVLHDDPMEQGGLHGLSVSANAAKDRQFFALSRDADGKRFVVQPTKSGGVKLWDNGKAANIKDPFTFADNGKFQITTKKGTPVDFTMHHAMADEITQHARINGEPPKYYNDARFSALVSNLQLGSMARHLELINDIKQDPRWKAWTTTTPTTEQLKKGWATSNMPNFKGLYMHPDLKALFDDFAGNPQTSLQALNAAVTKLIFVSPTAHWANVAGHLVTARGWDNMSIPKNMEMLRGLPSVVKSVMTQDAQQQAFNRAGAGTVYGRVLTQDAVKQLGDAFGLAVKRNPGKFQQLADKFGVKLPDLVGSVYSATKHALWAGSDVMMTLRYQELMRKGMSMRDAVVNAERDIPNYRTPTNIYGSRQVAEKLFKNSFFAFSRYHFGMLNAYANEFKDLFGKDATAGDRVDAAGKLLTTGIVAMVVMPLMDKLWQGVTGNPNAEANRRGPLTIPHHIAGALKGTEDIMAPVRSALTMSPLASTALETLSNHDWTGHNIVAPGDVAQAAQGHVAGAARAVGAEVEHAGRGLVAPANMVASEYQKTPPAQRGAASLPAAVGRTVRNQLLDIKDKSPAAANYERQIGRHNQQDVTQEYRKPKGPLMQVINSIFGR